MRTKKMLLGMLLGASLAASAQWPTYLNLNTATNASNTGLVTPVNGNDLHWWSNNSSLTGTYVHAVRVSGPGVWTASPNPAAGWISHPHGCATEQSQSWCIIPSDHDEYYKVDITLGAPGLYTLKFKIWADNCVYKMYLNSTNIYTTPGSSYYVMSDHLGSGIPFTITGGWVAGVNTLYIHVKSGVDAAHSAGNTGMLFSVVDTSYVAGDQWPDYKPVDPDTDPDPEDPQDPKDPCCLGNPCSKPKNRLGSDYEIPLNKYNFNFSGDQSMVNKVNVGYDCRDAGYGKLNAVTAQQTNNNDDGNNGPQSISIYGRNNFGKALTGVGVMGVADNGVDQSSCAGVWGEAKGVTNNTGGNFFGRNGSQYNIGVSGVAFGAPGGAAPYTYMTGNANIGVYGAIDPEDAAKNPGSSWAGWFDGDINLVGAPFSSAGGVWSTSDRRFKKDIRQLEGVTEKLKKLKGYTYNFKTDEFKNMNFSKTEQIGVVAQELKEIFPQLVTERNGYNYVNYSGLVPVLLEGFKEQQRAIEQQSQINADLQQQLNEQKELIKSMKATGLNSDNGLDIGFRMSQNEPNPFTHETVIKYTLPQTVASAFMAVYNLTGKQIATFPITEKGSAALTVTSEKLSAGIYIYSIVADGKVVDSKRMIVAAK